MGFSPIHCRPASFLNTVYRREGGFRGGSSIKARGGQCDPCPLSFPGQHLPGVSLYQCMSKQERSLLAWWLLLQGWVGGLFRPLFQGGHPSNGPSPPFFSAGFLYTLPNSLLAPARIGSLSLQLLIFFSKENFL